jgi:antitoxin (DNA-binding transcriptional repressor) of toxin-antitoxin stability system
MLAIQASEFKDKCFALLDLVAQTGQAIVVIKNGKPVAELHPHRASRARSLIGLHKGHIRIRGDIVASAGPWPWEEMKCLC